MDITELLARINKEILNPIIYLLFFAATIYFVLGVIKFISNADNDEERSKGKSNIIWGIVGMVIMVSAYAILALVTNSFNVSIPF